MRLPTIIKAVAAALYLMAPVKASALSIDGEFPIQLVLINTGEPEYMHLNGLISASMAGTMAAQAPVIAEARNMSRWQRRYKNYLADGMYVLKSIQASSTIYIEGMQCLISLSDLAKALEENPVQGLPATAMMNNSLLETAVDFVKVFRTLKSVCTKSGIEAMANGKQRTDVLWEISGELTRLNSKLRHLANSVRWYNMMEVFWAYTLPYGIYSHKQIAENCFYEWKRRAW